MRKKFFEEHRGLVKKVSSIALALLLAGTGIVTYQNYTKTDIPELVSFTDPDSVSVADEDVPLASGTKTTTKTTKKTTTKKTKLKKKAKKTAVTTKKSTKQSTTTSNTSNATIQKNTKVNTTIKNSTKKNSNVKTTKTTVITTVKTMTTAKASETSSTATATAQTTQTAARTTSAAAGTYNVKSVAPAADSRVLDAFTKMGFSVVVNPNASYSGCMDSAKRTLTLKSLDNTIYHELGHYLEFVGGTSQVKQMIASAYNSEKSLYTAYNKAYVLQNSSEYFAESYKNYCENPGALMQARPNTYQAIVAALNSVTDSRVNTIIGVYSAIWK